MLSNFLQFYLRGRSGLVFYRGLELAQSARSLTLIAQYARFTGDTALPLATRQASFEPCPSREP